MAYATDTRAWGSTVGQRISEFRALIADRAARNKVYRQTLRELEQLTSRDLSDLGISRESIRDLAREAAYGR